MPLEQLFDDCSSSESESCDPCILAGYKADDAVICNLPLGEELLMRKFDMQKLHHEEMYLHSTHYSIHPRNPHMHLHRNNSTSTTKMTASQKKRYKMRIKNASFLLQQKLINLGLMDQSIVDRNVLLYCGLSKKYYRSNGLHCMYVTQELNQLPLPSQEPYSLSDVKWRISVEEYQCDVFIHDTNIMVDIVRRDGSQEKPIYTIALKAHDFSKDQTNGLVATKKRKHVDYYKHR